MIDTTLDCQTAGKEFIVYLDSFSETSTSSRHLKSIKASFKLQFAQHKIDAFVAKLDDLRSKLLLAITLGLRTTIKGNQEEILERLRELKKDEHTTRILGTNDLRTVFVNSRYRTDEVRIQMDELLDRIAVVRHDLPQQCTRDKAILNWLNFRQMTWRYEQVPLAYQQTFQWIFEEPNSDRTWNNFLIHLSNDVGFPYFVNGKAGSGKSTLMKFMAEHPCTNEALARWASDSRPLLMLKYFFWHLGTRMQKSVIGMLRALIHNVLSSYPELIPAVFPTQSRDWDGEPIEEEPIYSELKKAFDNLIAETAKSLKICIFIDGMDEFEGDHRDVSEWLCSLVKQHGHIKVIVSSRPLTECLSTFRDCPTLRLQDLTKGDMEIFIEGNLDAHRDMRRLTKRYPIQAASLVKEIQDKAQGVFLWVSIVVRLLIDGLEGGDDFEDLQARLRSLPPDLRDLYKRMFNQMKNHYRVEAAKIFQLMHAWNSNTSDPFTTTTLFFASIQPSEALLLPDLQVDSATLELFHDNTEARIRSRCCGLLEVHTRVVPRDTIDQALGSRVKELVDHVVEYLHRTVSEFLAAPEVWNELCALTSPSGFDPLISLSSACLSMVRTGNHPLSACNNMTAFLRKAPQLSSARLAQYVDALDLAYIQQDAYSRKCDSSHLCFTRLWARHHPVDPIIYNYQEPLEEAANVFTFAAQQGLTKYLRALYAPPDTVRRLVRVAPVLYALQSWLIARNGSPQLNIPVEDRRNTLLFLLQHRLEEEAPEDALIERAQECVNGVLKKQMEQRLGQHQEDYAVFMAICFTTARSPQKVYQQYNLPGSTSFSDLASILLQSKDPDNKNLGRGMILLVQKVTVVCRLMSVVLTQKEDFLAKQAEEIIKEKDQLLRQSLEAVDYIIQQNKFTQTVKRQRVMLVKMKLRLESERTSRCQLIPHMETADQLDLRKESLDRLLAFEGDDADVHELGWEVESPTEQMLIQRVDQLTKERNDLVRTREALMEEACLEDSGWVLV